MTAGRRKGLKRATSAAKSSAFVENCYATPKDAKVSREGREVERKRVAGGSEGGGIVVVL